MHTELKNHRFLYGCDEWSRRYYFYGGNWENSSYIRKLVCTDMEYFGMELDEAKNEIRSKEMREINTAHSKTKIMVIPTNEEMEIANQVYDLLIS
jgi:acetate kinase